MQARKLVDGEMAEGSGVALPGVDPSTGTALAMIPKASGEQIEAAA